MDNEPDVTRLQMDDTRAALSDKMENLEQHVMGMMQGATDAVAETVETVKDAVHDTVETVKDTLDISLQMKRHPWGVITGSIALGYLGGYLLVRSGRGRGAATRTSLPGTAIEPRVDGRRNGFAHGDSAAKLPVENQRIQESMSRPTEPDRQSGTFDQFMPEFNKLKGLAIGTVLGVVRDRLTQSAPESMRTVLAEVLDSVTVKLGGEPTPGPVLNDAGNSKTAAREDPDASKMDGTRKLFSK